MARFNKKKPQIPYRNAILSVLVFLAVIGCFQWAVSVFSVKSSREQMDALEETLRQSAVHCYAMEGFYPESLDYLIEHYHIVYDSDHFFVDYQPVGENIMPDITVIEKNN